MGTLDNIYVLNYVVNRQIRKKVERLAAMFVNLKAVFDLVDKGFW